MKTQYVSIIFLFIIAVLVLAPVVVFADHSGIHLVPECRTLGKATNVCGICDLFVLVQNVLNFIFVYIVIPLAIMFVVYGGFLMIVPFSNPNLIERGKRVLKNALIGIFIIFIAWLAIDSVIKLLANQSLISGAPAQLPTGPNSFGPWNRIDCSRNREIPT